MKTTIRTNSKKLLADLQTPVSIYLKIRDIYPESVLLESSDYHGGENSYSFIGLKAAAKFKVENGEIIEQYPNGEIVRTVIEADFALPEHFNKFVQSFEITENNNQLPFNGFFGYTSYDAVRYFENVHIEPEVNEAQVPDMYYIFYK
jgi:anthranilate synthase component 1